MKIINNKVKRLSLVVLISLLQFSCAHNQQDVFPDEKLVQCANPKPQICTREYKPVCGFESDGNHKTFSNSCTACSNPDVLSYCEGDCEKLNSLPK